MWFDIEDALICEELDFSKFHVVCGCFNSTQAYITANNLHVQFRLDLPYFFYLSLEQFILLLHMNRPVLEWVLRVECTHWLF